MNEVKSMRCTFASGKEGQTRTPASLAVSGHLRASRPTRSSADGDGEHTLARLVFNWLPMVEEYLSTFSILSNREFIWVSISPTLFYGGDDRKGRYTCNVLMVFVALMNLE